MCRGGGEGEGGSGLWGERFIVEGHAEGSLTMLTDELIVVAYLFLFFFSRRGGQGGEGFEFVLMSLQKG